MKNRIVVAAVVAALFAGNAQSAEFDWKKYSTMAGIDAGSALLMGLITTIILKEEGQSLVKAFKAHKLAVGSSMLIAAGLAHIAGAHGFQTKKDLDIAKEIQESKNTPQQNNKSNSMSFEEMPRKEKCYKIDKIGGENIELGGLWEEASNAAKEAEKIASLKAEKETFEANNENKFSTFEEYNKEVSKAEKDATNDKGQMNYPTMEKILGADQYALHIKICGAGNLVGVDAYEETLVQKMSESEAFKKHIAKEKAERQAREQSINQERTDELDKVIELLPTELDYLKPWKVFEGKRLGAATPEEFAPRSWKTRLSDVALWNYTDLQPTDNGVNEVETH
ncbi:hypothetical protein HOD08_02365 [bacterium]|nr:hypothetical protein [bacterium]